MERLFHRFFIFSGFKKTCQALKRYMYTYLYMY